MPGKQQVPEDRASPAQQGTVLCQQLQVCWHSSPRGAQAVARARKAGMAAPLQRGETAGGRPGLFWHREPRVLQ